MNGEDDDEENEGQGILHINIDICIYIYVHLCFNVCVNIDICMYFLNLYVLCINCVCIDGEKGDDDTENEGQGEYVDIN
jgi:hypothetical protein